MFSMREYILFFSLGSLELWVSDRVCNEPLFQYYVWQFGKKPDREIDSARGERREAIYLPNPIRLMKSQGISKIQEKKVHGLWVKSNLPASSWGQGYTNSFTHDLMAAVLKRDIRMVAA